MWRGGWVTRSRAQHLNYRYDQTIVITGRERSLIVGIVLELQDLGYSDLAWFDGSQEIWSQAGFEIERTPDMPEDRDCIDFLFFVHDRHEGNLDAARRYLEWETGLLAQLDTQERCVLTPPAPNQRPAMEELRN